MSLLQPDWPQPESVTTVVTTRIGGVSTSPYDSLNLALHVDDQAADVELNREIVAKQTNLGNGDYQWQWLQQVHGNTVVQLNNRISVPAADGLTTAQTKLVCCVLTADCLPILLCNEAGTEVGIAHGGWRGLASGIIASTVHAMRSDARTLMAWLGPAIGPCHFEVGAEVRAQFLESKLGDDADKHFRSTPSGKYLTDLYGIARSQLQLLGITKVFGGQFCTFCEEDRFFSYRRDGLTGRMLSAICLDP